MKAILSLARSVSTFRSSAMSSCLVSLLAFSIINIVKADLAFPTAVGFGATATGGRGGAVYHVTNLNDSGTGSFRDAVSVAGRTIVFDVGGYIVLSSAVSAQSNLTIAGQTAPGDGIGIMGAEVSFYGRSNIICRYVRFRQGSLGSSSQSGLNLGSSANTAANMIFDHVSVEFGSYDSVDAVRTANVTFQNSIIADPIGQQFGAHVEGGSFTWYRNLWANAHNRQPLAKNNTQYINNVVYNYAAAYTVADTGGVFSHDIVNNYFITGPATTSAGNNFYQMNSNQSVYSSGNLRDSNKDGVLNGSSSSPSGVTVLSSPWVSTTSSLSSLSAASAYSYVLAHAGALPHDSVDNFVLGQVQSVGTSGPGGGLYTSQSQTGLSNNGYGTLAGGTHPTDTDNDGIPDAWESAHGLNPNNAADASAVSSTHAPYTNLEVYLGSLVGEF